MTKDRRIKAGIRRRMAKTGEAYCSARHNILQHEDLILGAPSVPATETRKLPKNLKPWHLQPGDYLDLHVTRNGKPVTKTDAALIKGLVSGLLITSSALVGAPDGHAGYVFAGVVGLAEVSMPTLIVGVRSAIDRGYMVAGVPAEMRRDLIAKVGFQDFFAEETPLRLFAYFALQPGFRVPFDQIPTFETKDLTPEFVRSLRREKTEFVLTNVLSKEWTRIIRLFKGSCLQPRVTGRMEGLPLKPLDGKAKES